MSCCIQDCDTTRRYNPNKYTFHRFPTNISLREKWIRIVDRGAWTPIRSSTVCSKHFEPQNFIQRKHRLVLMKDSIPTLFVPVQIKERKPSSYIYRDIALPSESLPRPSRLSPRKIELTKKCSLLRKIILRKNKALKYLKTKLKRMSKQLLDLKKLVKELKYNKSGLNDHQNLHIICQNDSKAC